jgi:hypothetical protein
MAIASQTPQSTAANAPDIQMLNDLERAIVEAVIYADIFDYPLTAAEVHRYLPHVEASPAMVAAALQDGRLIPTHLWRHGDYFLLPGRETAVASRELRASYARCLWPRAEHYAHIIASLPFVRMLAVTGSLAVDNVDAGGDIDYLIVTESGRLWLCRALVILVVRAAARWGDALCPNYFVSERALLFQERNLYTARELAQMVPLAGLATYCRLRQLNRWTESFLPNAGGPPRQVEERNHGRAPWRSVAESVLRSPLGGWLERWEMTRKLHKFERQRAQFDQQNGSSETQFGVDWCRGHFEGHGARTLGVFAQRLRALE